MENSKDLKDHVIDDQQKAFTDNAFFLLANHERILSDKRMRYAPINVENGLLYTGTAGFKNAVLGVYLEWWLSCKAALQCPDGVNPSLIWFFVGSPLSGSNSCRSVDERGNIQTVHILDFLSAWTGFTDINCRYAGVKGRKNPYSLCEVIALLKADKDSKSADRAAAWAFKQRCTDLKAANAALESQVKQLQLDCEKAYTLLHIDEIRHIHAEISARINEHEREIAQLQARRRAAKAQQHSGEITPQEAQRLIVSILKDKEARQTEISNIEKEYCERLKAIDPHLTQRGVDAALK